MIVLLPLLFACANGLGAYPEVDDSGEPVDSAPDDTDTDTDTEDTSCDEQPWFLDADGDGYGDPVSEVVVCDAPPTYIPTGGDCDDADAAVHPGSTQQIDGFDSDCDGQRDWLVTFYITVDDAFEWCLDHEDNVVGSGGNWQQAYTWQQYLESGTHTVGIKGWDTGQVITAGIAHIEMTDGTSWVTDGTWKYDPSPASTGRVGWCQNTFDDSAWQSVKVIGPAFTTSPWTGAPSGMPSDTAAQWIWDHYPVNLNTQYLRKEIVLP